MSPKFFIPILAVVLLAGSAQAQYTGDNQTNTISGVAIDWTGNGAYYVGQYYAYDALTIQNGGVLSNTFGFIGWYFNSSNNTVLVTDSGSVWSNTSDLIVGDFGAVGNSLTISNGGAVFNGYGYIGDQTGASSNTVLVTGSGSVWNNAFDVYVGQYGSGNSLTIASNGTVYNGYGWIGAFVSFASNNSALVTGSGSVWSNADDLSVGYDGAGNSLTISNGGRVYNGVGYIGNQYDADDNSVLVTGSGSVWSNADRLYVGYSGAEGALTVASSGTVYSTEGYIGNQFSANNNAVLVTGSGSVWYSGIGLNVGNAGSGNSLTVSNGGAVAVLDCSIGGVSDNNAMLVTGPGSVCSNYGYLFVGYYGSDNLLTIADGGADVTPGGPGAIGYATGASNNTVLVSGIGSIWSAYYLYVGFGGSGNSLTIAANGSVVANNAYIGYVYTNGGNGITISGGGLSVTNGAVDVRDGVLTLNSGTVTVNQLVLTNGASSVIAFNAGQLTSSGTSVTNSQLFVVGDGTDAAMFQLNGGVHSFAVNLEISNNAVLSGCGTIEGNVTIDPGGTVLANCGGNLTFTGIVTNNGTMVAANGSVLQAYGPVVNNGVINAINGSTQFLGGLVNNGCVLTETDVQISSITRLGNNVTVQIPSGTCATYQLEVTPSLKPTNWTNVGTSQGGTGGLLTFTDSGGATNRPGRFYRIDITLP